MRLRCLQLISTFVLVVIVTNFSFSLINASSLPFDPSHEDYNDSQDRLLTSEEMALKLHKETQAHVHRCVTPLGTLLGVGLGVAAYSNCNDRTVTMDDHTVIYDTHANKIYEKDDPVGNELLTNPNFKGEAFEVTTGMSWQCVEYARRFLLHTYGLIFQDCGAAVDIWRVTFVYRPQDKDLLNTNPGAMKRYHLERYPNFATIFGDGGIIASSNQPKAGDVVVWPIQKDMPFGHVGILVAVEPVGSETTAGSSSSSSISGTSSNNNNMIVMKPVDINDPKIQAEDRDTLVAVAKLAEQNYANKDWLASSPSGSEARSFARELHVYRRAKTNRLALKDPDGYKILGWMRARPDVLFHGAYSHIDDGLELDVQGATGLPKRVHATEANTMMMKNNEEGNEIVYDEKVHGEKLRNLNRREDSVDF